MGAEKPKNVRALLREHKQEQEFIWRTLVGRTELLKELAKNDDHTFLFRLAERIDRYNAMEDLYRNLIRKRAETKTSSVQGNEMQFSPFERQSVSITERLSSGLDKTWFKLN